MTPDQREAVLAALEAAQRAVEAGEAAQQALRAVLARDDAETGDMVPLAEARERWGCSKDAALKRARRGLGRKIAGHWHVPAAAVFPPSRRSKGGADE